MDTPEPSGRACLSEFEDRVAINDVLARYADGVNRRDSNLWSNCWDEYGSWSLSHEHVVVGRAAIVEKWLKVMADCPHVTMFAMQGSIVISGDRADGMSYSNEIIQMRNGKEFQVAGEYADQYLRRDQQWFFSARRFTQRRICAVSNGR